MSFPEDTLLHLKELAIKNYSPEAVIEFLTTHPLDTVLSQALKADFSDDKNFHGKMGLQRLLELPQVFSKLLTEANTRDILEKFVTNPHEDHREFIAEAIAKNVDVAVETLNSYQSQPEGPVIQGFIKTLFFLLKDPESQVGLKISKLFTKLAKTMVNDTTRDYLVDSNLAQTTIKQLLSCGDAVVEIRTLETLVHMGNEAPRLYTIFEKHGFITQGLELYKKYFDEILEKMNIVDVISQLGSTEEGCNILCAHPAFKAIKKEALSKDTDPFVAKSLGILLIELANHDKIPYTFMLFKDLRIRLEEMFMAGFGEELNACFDMIRSFGRSVEGFNVVYQTKSIIQKLCVSCHSNKDGEQRKALEGFLGLVTPVKKYLETTKKGKTLTLTALNEEGRPIELLVSYLGNPTLVKSVIDLNDEMYLKNSMVFIIDSLLLPFVETELLFLRILFCLVDIEPLLNAFCKSPKSLEYLHMKLAKSKEVFDAKNDFKQHLIHRLNHLKETVKDSFYEIYLKEYRIKEEQRKQELMQYASDTAN